VLPFRCAVKCSLFIIKLLVSVLITSYKFRQFNVKKKNNLLKVQLLIQSDGKK